jgi:Domain of unknown function (DUF4340)
MNITRSIYMGVVLLVLGGSGALYASEKDARDTAQHALVQQIGILPKVGLSGATTDQVDKIELLQPEGTDSQPRITLEKHRGSWVISTPIRGLASVSKVDALLENLKGLTLSDVVDPGAAAYDRYGLTDAKAFNVVTWSGKNKLSDLYFGKSSARGQLVRVAGITGVYGIDARAAGSYSGFLYTRPLRSWRETSILSFDDNDVVTLQISNRHGSLSFAKTGGGWSGSFRVRNSAGKLGEPSREWRTFDEGKVHELLQAYRALSADEFGEETDRDEAGLDHAEQTGGVISIRLKTGDAMTIRVGRVANGPSTWSIKDSRWAMRDGDGTLYAIALWNADWATAEATCFQNGATLSTCAEAVR